MPTPWIRDPDPTLPIRLLCFPHAGGGSLETRPWVPRARERGIDVLPVLLPGREARLSEAPFRAMSPLVEALTGALRPHLDRPYAVFGHSLGGLVAFAWVRRLRAAGVPLPVRLFVSQRRAPDTADRYPPLHPLPDDAFLKAMQERYGPMPAELLRNPDVLALFLRPLRADFTLLETYRFVEEAPLPLPITALAATDDPTLTPDEVAGWARHTGAGLRVASFVGGHFYHRSRSAEVLAEIAADLGR